MEDIALCEGVQKGLKSPAFCRGNYALTVGNAMYHFHGLLHRKLKGVKGIKQILKVQMNEEVGGSRKAEPEEVTEAEKVGAEEGRELLNEAQNRKLMS